MLDSAECRNYAMRTGSRTRAQYEKRGVADSRCPCPARCSRGVLRDESARAQVLLCIGKIWERNALSKILASLLSSVRATHARAHACSAHTCTHAPMHAHKHARMYTCTHAYIRTCVHALQEDDLYLMKTVATGSAAVDNACTTVGKLRLILFPLAIMHAWINFIHTGYGTAI